MSYVFDIRARVNCDNIATEKCVSTANCRNPEKRSLQSNTQVVSHSAVDSGAAIIKVVVCKHNQDGVLSLLALDEDSVATEEL